VLRRADRFEAKEELAEYQFAGTYSFGRGIFRGDKKQGASFQLPKVQRIKTDDFIYCKIMAWEGAFGLASKHVDGCVLSGAFVAYEINRKRLDPKFIDYFFKIKSVWKNIGNKSTGTNVRRQSLHQDEFEAATIPLPPLAEQRCIVARIDELAAKIEEARGLRLHAAEEAEAFVTSLHAKLSGTRIKKLSEILRLDEDAVLIKPTDSYPQVGVRGFGGGLFAKPATSGMDTTYRAFNRLYEGALVMSQVKAWEGAVAVCGKNLAGYFVSPEYRTFRFDPSEAIPSYFAAIVKTEWFWSRLKDATRGVGARRERTRPEQFLNIEIPVPELVQQKEAEIIFKKIDSLKRLQAETAAELDAMLSSILDKAFKGEL
jgi:type I restriction enzyme S subunit